MFHRILEKIIFELSKQSGKLISYQIQKILGYPLMPKNSGINTKNKKQMEKLIQAIVEKTGISPENAQTAITTVLDSLRDKLPAGIGDKISSFVKDTDGDGDIDFNDIMDSFKNSLGGLFGGK